MRMYLISDNNDTLVGFRMTGVLGSLVRTPEALSEALDGALADRSLGILMITEGIDTRFGADIRARLRDRSLPLLVTIPSENSSGTPRAGVSK